MKKFKKIITFGIVTVLSIGMLTGCGLLDSEVNELNGTIKGNTYNVGFYSNDGENFMNMSGQQIDMASNTVEEPIYTDGSWGYSETMSSVVTITIDGKEVESCGSTMLFAEDGLKAKNNFGKNRVVVIQSQLGDPICAYSGDEVYWKVCKDLPKTTKLMIDGKALYIHRANFQIIDKSLLN